MLLQDALLLLTKLVKENIVNVDRARAMELADKYYKLITGDNIESLLIQFVQREDEELFDQRTRLTKSITPAVAASIRKPFNKVVRNDRVRKSIGTTNKTRTDNIYKMIKLFFGAGNKQNRGLDYWLKTRFLELQFTDPNAWVVVEWGQPNNPSEVITPRPFEVSSSMAYNWLIVNDEVKWLEVKQPIVFFESSSINPADKGAVITKKDGFRYTLYDEDVTVVYEQVNESYLKYINYILKPGEDYVTINEVLYLVKTFKPNIGYVPAFRVGYIRDEVTKGRTFVNPWHDALCFFEKSLKSVSEMDLTMALHVFPQKLQYVQKCIGEEKNGRPGRCFNGKNAVGETCKACGGKGVRTHTTSADVISIPMPEDPKDMVSLDELLVYKAPPIETIKFQNDYITQLQAQAHQAVFNSQIFVRKQYSSSEGGQSPTATESDYNMQSVYDTLEPFTEKYSELWMDIVSTFAIIAGEAIEKIKVVHAFPADFKLKTQDVLLSERKAAGESGAPSFMIETLEDDLADIIFAGDDLKLKKYYIKKQYFPFPGKSQDEIAVLLASQYVPKYQKVLYSNFDEVFKEIEKENPEVWAGNPGDAKIDELVKNKVTEFIDRIGTQAPVFDISNFRNASPITDAQEQG